MKNKKVGAMTLHEYLQDYSNYKIEFRIQDPDDEYNMDYDNLEDFETGGYSYLLNIPFGDLHTITIYPQGRLIHVYYEQPDDGIADDPDDECYTFDRWTKSRVFTADPGQEVDADIYDKMKMCADPLPLPPQTAETARGKYHLNVTDGFLVGQPVKNGLYMAFVRGTDEFGSRCLYMGDVPIEKRLDGTYYAIECGNAFVSGLYPAAEFPGDAEAIRTAMDYEATLYRVEYKDGDRISSTLLCDRGIQ